MDAKVGEPRRGWGCPSHGVIASYLEQRLDAREKSRFEDHLADCDFCLGLIGGLARQQKTREPVEVPDFLVRQAISLAPVKGKQGLPRRGALVPALASLVVAGAVLLNSPQPGNFVPRVSAPTVEKVRQPEVAPKPPGQHSEESDIRSLKAATLKLLLLEPRPESVVRRKGLQFRWKPLGGAAYYEIRVLDSQGDAVWQRQTSNSAAQLPSELPLQPGKYFVWVHVYFKDGRMIKSDTIGFTVANSS
jgi:hypothetical protein